MLIVIVEGIAVDKKRIHELAEPIHVVDPALASIEQLVDEAAPKKTSERKMYLAELRQLRPSGPPRLYLRSCENRRKTAPGYPLEWDV
jgi:hypothetical protein